MLLNVRGVGMKIFDFHVDRLRLSDRFAVRSELRSCQTAFGCKTDLGNVEDCYDW